MALTPISQETPAGNQGRAGASGGCARADRSIIRSKANAPCL
ncbi:hypothetical protein SAMN06296416_103302 [Pseudoxanthomonas wuyuanensis]|uniref:Uncharacterized protein n=1 Tax=Pseudoxanthomonas wuyuanensis TaxID=1073196 RepID=A0A286D6X0_9GAMM|nr:hypothetical protein SAMN06296416_103302 [Pseudoxanthomonas wuyuanensis]